MKYRGQNICSRWCPSYLWPLWEMFWSRHLKGRSELCVCTYVCGYVGNTFSPIPYPATYHRDLPKRVQYIYVPLDSICNPCDGCFRVQWHLLQISPLVHFVPEESLSSVTDPGQCADADGPLWGTLKVKIRNTRWVSGPEFNCRVTLVPPWHCIEWRLKSITTQGVADW